MLARLPWRPKLPPACPQNRSRADLRLPHEGKTFYKSFTSCVCPLQDGFELCFYYSWPSKVRSVGVKWITQKRHMVFMPLEKDHNSHAVCLSLCNMDGTSGPGLCYPRKSTLWGNLWHMISRNLGRLWLFCCTDKGAMVERRKLLWDYL